MLGIAYERLSKLIAVGKTAQEAAAAMPPLGPDSLLVIAIGDR